MSRIVLEADSFIDLKLRIGLPAMILELDLATCSMLSMPTFIKILGQFP
jgi:hypothetical protein